MLGHDPLGTKSRSCLTPFPLETGAPGTIHLTRNWHVEEMGSIPTVGRAVVVHRLRPRWPVGTLWARSGHEAPSRIVYRKPTYHLTRRFIGSGQAYRPQHAKCLHSRLQKWPFIRSFVGLDGIEPSASALSELDKRLLRPSVCRVTCRFVPQRATQRRLVPLRLGTLWARTKRRDLCRRPQCLPPTQCPTNEATLNMASSINHKRSRDRRTLPLRALRFDLPSEEAAIAVSGATT